MQFGWQHISLGTTSGAQSLPRVIKAATESEGGGLRFLPLPELESLHIDSTFSRHNFTATPSATVDATGAYTMLDVTDQHVRLALCVCCACFTGLPNAAVPL